MLWYEDTCCVLSQWTSSLVRRPLDPGIIRTSDSDTNMVTVSRHLETLELTSCNQLGDLAWIHDVVMQYCTTMHAMVYKDITRDTQALRRTREETSCA